MTPYATFHDLDGVSVFITGGGSGIGAALSEGFLAQGAKVAFVQRSDASAFVAEMAGKYAHDPLFIPCDITDIPALSKAMQAAASAHGPITRLVNNAANDTRHTVAETTVEDWDAYQNVNLRPHFFTAQTVAPMMKAAGYGSIVNFSSIAYMMGMAGMAGYVTAKAAVTGLTRALARELGPDQIRVNAVMPGWVLTQRQMDLWATPEDLAAHLERQCLPEHLAPRDIVDAVLFLSSQASRMITGQAMVVDGGVAVTG
ncbi:SDR family oxidoreductase [Pseudosulfitobacter sp. DSM 107133]|uniref:SDR family NAD(P)-dependent oxidoreductase n=1 Tax=Pseudosulfitobacter sp. DSM 107133 TaxID=2883100 RepID=UPI000DF1479C|nr:SDR family oxidoreductase [Pseudosulfitobacter sp. DSM 107133]UOA26695.1 Sulfoquinovose 1-dehydrogenase [Pseudosulfitobacter sp. DSM 107133]